MLTGVRAAALVTVAVVTTAVAAVAGCGSGGGGGAVPRSAPVTSASAATPGSPAPAATAPATPSGATGSSGTGSSGTAAGCDVGPWRSAPVTVTHKVPVPPVPVITAVRTAQHPECGYDRIVLDVSGPLPGYSVRYVTQAKADASGATIVLPGKRYLLITLRPAQAHTLAGAATVASGIQRPGYPALTSWALAGDFEGVVTLAAGLPGQLSIRTGELPGRIYIDIRE